MFEHVAKRKNSIVEVVDFGKKQKDYYVVSLLLNIEIAPDDVIIEAINSINQKKQIIFPWYGCINTEYPKKKFIDETRDFLEERFMEKT